MDLREIFFFLPLGVFLPYTLSQHLAQPAFIKASLGAGSSSMKVAGPLTEVRNRSGASVCLNHTGVLQKVLVGRSLRPYGTLYQPLPGFEPTL